MASGATGARLAVPVATRLMLRAADRLPAAVARGPLPALAAPALGSAHAPASALRIVEPPMGGVVQSSTSETGVHVRLALPPGAAGAVVVIDGRHRFHVGPSGRAFLRASPGDHELVAYGGEATATATVRFALR
jgi:hypothetical protein